MKLVLQRMKSFATREDGSIAVETVIIIPILFWGYLTLFSIFDAYRQYAIGQKVAYTVGDIISRETTPIDNSYMDGMRHVVEYMTAAQDVADVALRVTSVRYDEENNEYERDWSEKRGWVPALDDNAVSDLADRLPVMPDNERVMIVETFVKYDPPFDTGLTNKTITNFVFTRPRYAPQVLYSDGS